MTAQAAIKKRVFDVACTESELECQVPAPTHDHYGGQRGIVSAVPAHIQVSAGTTQVHLKSTIRNQRKWRSAIVEDGASTPANH